MAKFDQYFSNPVWAIIDGAQAVCIPKGNITTNKPVELFDNEQAWQNRKDELGIVDEEEE